MGSPYGFPPSCQDSSVLLPSSADGNKGTKLSWGSCSCAAAQYVVTMQQQLAFPKICSVFLLCLEVKKHKHGHVSEPILEAEEGKLGLQHITQKSKV